MNRENMPFTGGLNGFISDYYQLTYKAPVDNYPYYVVSIDSRIQLACGIRANIVGAQIC